MSKTAMQILLSERVISFNPLLADIAGDTEGGLFLSQCCFMGSRVSKDAEGWFYSTDEQWYESTRLLRGRIIRIRKQLNKLGLLYFKVKGQAHKTFYRVDFEKLEALLIGISSSNSAQMSKSDVCADNEQVKKCTDVQNERLQMSDSNVCKRANQTFANEQIAHTKRVKREKEEKIKKEYFSAEKDKSESDSVDKSPARLKFEEAKRELVRGTGLRPKKTQAEAA